MALMPFNPGYKMARFSLFSLKKKHFEEARSCLFLKRLKGYFLLALALKKFLYSIVKNSRKKAISIQRFFLPCLILRKRNVFFFIRLAPPDNLRLAFILRLACLPPQEKNFVMDS